MEHFGVKLINRGKGFNLTRDGFALICTKPSLPYFKSLASPAKLLPGLGSRLLIRSHIICT